MLIIHSSAFKSHCIVPDKFHYPLHHSRYKKKKKSTLVKGEEITQASGRIKPKIQEFLSTLLQWNKRSVCLPTTVWVVFKIIHAWHTQTQKNVTANKHGAQYTLWFALAEVFAIAVDLFTTKEILEKERTKHWAWYKNARRLHLLSLFYRKVLIVAHPLRHSGVGLGGVLVRCYVSTTYEIHIYVNSSQPIKTLCATI